MKYVLNSATTQQQTSSYLLVLVVACENRATIPNSFVRCDRVPKNSLLIKGKDTFQWGTLCRCLLGELLRVLRITVRNYVISTTWVLVLNNHERDEGETT
jgi:hypothetical protein